MELLLKDYEKCHISTRTPVYVDRNLEFIVDTSRLLHWRDVQLDLSGFSRTKTKSLYYSSTLDTFTDISSNYDVLVTRFIFIHRIHKNFHKVIVSLTRKGEKHPEKLFYVQDYFDGEEQAVDFGASMSKNKTKFSTREKIKELSSKGWKGKKY